MGCLILVKDLCRQAHLIGRKIIIGFMRAVGTHCDGSTGGVQNRIVTVQVCDARPNDVSRASRWQQKNI